MKLTSNTISNIILNLNYLYPLTNYSCDLIDSLGNTTQNNNINLIFKLEGFENATPITYLNAELQNFGTNNECIILKPSLKLINNNETLAYNLSSNNYINDNTPKFIDIPKNIRDISYQPLLITPMLNGESIIFTELDKNNYRVFFDRRENSSILYENVVFSFDAMDYQFTYNSSNNQFATKQKENIFLFAQCTEKAMWAPHIYSDIDSKNKMPNTYQVSTNQVTTKNKFIHFKRYKLNQLKDLANYLNTNFNNPLTIPNTNVDNWSVSEIETLLENYYTHEQTLIQQGSYGTNPVNNQIYLQNLDNLYNGWVSLVRMMHLLEDKKKNGFTSVVKIVDQAGTSLLSYQTKEQVIAYKLVALYYHNTKNPDFVRGYTVSDEILKKTYGSISLNDLYTEFSNTDITSLEKGKLIKIIHLKDMELEKFYMNKSMNDLFRDLSTEKNPIKKEDLNRVISLKNSSSGGILGDSILRYNLERFFDFHNQAIDYIPFRQNNILSLLHLNIGNIGLGICYGLTFLNSASIELGEKAYEGFKNFLKEPNLNSDDIYFLRKVIENIQDGQEEIRKKLLPAVTTSRIHTIKDIKDSFDVDVIRNSLISGKNHVLSLSKIFNSKNKFSHYALFDSNVGNIDMKTIDETIKYIRDKITPEKINNTDPNLNEFTVEEFSLSKNKHNYNVMMNTSHVKTLLTNMANGQRLAPSLLHRAVSVITQHSSRTTSVITHTSQYDTSVANPNKRIKRAIHLVRAMSSQSLNGSLPLLGSIRQSGSTYSIDTVVTDKVTGVESIENKTITAQKYRAFKYLNSQIKELRAAGIRWDNELGKFIGVDSVNSFNDKSGKVFAFMELMQFISNRIAGEVLVDESKAELRDFIIAQVAIDLSATAIDTGTELVAPSVRYIKHAITGTGIKTFLNSFGMNGANFLKYANIGFGGLGVALSIASLGLSIKMLTHIDPNKDPHGFKIAVVNTTFAAIGTVLSTAAFVCSMTGLVAFAALFGAIGIIVGLIGMITVGIMSLAKASAEGVQAVIDFFKSIDQYANKPIFENKNGILIPAGLPITSINYNTGEIVLGKYLTYQSIINETLNDRSSGINYTIAADKKNKNINILSRFKILHVEKQTFSNIENKKIILLPATPNLVFDYSFTKGHSLDQNDLLIGKKLETEGNFIYEYKDPDNNIHIIDNLIPEVQNTDINVTLSPKNKFIIVPALNNDENKGLVTSGKITTNVSVHSKNKELHFCVGDNSHLKIESTAEQPIEYTFDFSWNKELPIKYFHSDPDVVHSFTKENNVYIINGNTKIELGSNLVKKDSFIVKDSFEEYTYNTKDDKKTYSVIDAASVISGSSIHNLSALTAKISSEYKTTPQCLINRIRYKITHHKSLQFTHITHGIYNTPNELIIDNTPIDFKDLKLENKISGGYFDKEVKLVYFYSYSESLIWAVDINGNLKQIFSLGNLDTTEKCFYSPSDNDFKLSSATPFNDGIIAKYIKNEKNNTHRELTVLCNKNGMNLIQSKVSNRKAPLVISPNNCTKDIKDNISLVNQEEECKRILNCENNTITNIKFSNLFNDYNLTVNKNQISISKTDEKSLGSYNIIEKNEQKEEFFSIVGSKEKQEVIKPICNDTSRITFLGETNGLYYFHSKRDGGRVYIQKGSGFEAKNNAQILDTVYTNICKDVRLVGRDLYLTTENDSLFSYNYNNQKKYTVHIINDTFSKVPTRDELQNKFPSDYKLADLVLLDSITTQNNKKVYSYLSTYVFLPQNHELLHIVSDDKDKDLRYIWYVDKDNNDMLYRLDSNLSFKNYNPDFANQAEEIDNIKDYSTGGFKIKDNIYKFINHYPGIEIVNSTEKHIKDGKVYNADLTPGYKIVKGVPKLESFLIANKNDKHNQIAINSDKNLKLIGKINEEVFFLNKDNNKIMVAKKDNNNTKNSYQNIVLRANDNNLFDDITKVDDRIIYSIKNNSIKLDSSYIDNCYIAHLGNISVNLSVTFEQQFMNQFNSCSIDDNDLEKLNLQFPDINDLIISIKDGTITLHDSLSNFTLVFDDILIIRTAELKKENIALHYKKNSKSYSIFLSDIVDKIYKDNGIKSSGDCTTSNGKTNVLISTLEECIK